MTNAKLSHRRRTHLAYLLLAGLLFAIFASLHGQTRTLPSALARWKDGRHATGEWLGLRPSLESRGIDFNGYWKGTFYGLTGGGLDSPRGAFDEEISLGLTIDFGRLAGIEGLTAQGAVRYRDGRSPNTYVGAGSTFNPSRYQSGQQWRLMPFFLTYTTPELFGVKDFLTISGGWQNAYTFFADQPESKLFTNNAIGTTKGIGGADGFPWGSSYAAWGGYLKVKPTGWSYAMAGLYLAIPEAVDRLNHGLDLAGYGPDPGANGLYFLAEAGLTPKWGPDKLPGKYAFGTIYWGLENTSFSGERHDQKNTFYWQVDQMVLRERTAPAPTTGKDGKEPVGANLGEQGLYAFAFFNYAPAYNDALPFYSHVGLVYKGLIPGRDKDQAGVAFGYGRYSEDKIEAEQAAGKTTHQTYEGVVEIDYRVQLTKSTFLQPFWQYIVRPGGAGQIPNANIFGLHMGVIF